MDYLIGIDLGTIATKAVLFDQSGIQIATSSQSYPLYRDAQGMAAFNACLNLGRY